MIRPLLLACLAGPAAAEGTPGEFDHYVLALSWSPAWCALEGEARGSPQCDEEANGGRGFAWTLHGLWPQHEEGWPIDCPSSFPGPSRRQAEGMADIMGGADLALHEWRRHGTCSGLSPGGYFALSRRAFEAARVPDLLARLPRAAEVPARVVEEAFLREDPRLVPDGVTVTCEGGRVAEVRLCLSRDLEPRPCGPDARRDCSLEDALVEPVP